MEPTDVLSDKDGDDGIKHEKRGVIMLDAWPSGAIMLTRLIEFYAELVPGGATLLVTTEEDRARGSLPLQIIIGDGEIEREDLLKFMPISLPESLLFAPVREERHGWPVVRYGPLAGKGASASRQTAKGKARKRWRGGW